VFEAYLGGRWWLFDGTRQAALDGLVRIGIGRDAAEVAFATPFGLINPGPIKIWRGPMASSRSGRGRPMRSALRRTRQTLARIDRIDQLGSVLKGLGYRRAKFMHTGSDCRYRIVRALYKHLAMHFSGGT
jgi:hypothetical protein